MGPNWAPFGSTDHGYGDKRQNQKSKMAAGGHLEYDVNMLDIQAFMPHGSKFCSVSLYGPPLRR